MPSEAWRRSERAIRSVADHELLPHIVSADTVIHGVLNIVWNDGYEGVVNLRPVMGRGRIFTCLRNPEFFKTVRVETYGHSIYWGEEGNEEVDFGSDRLREMAEEQAKLLAARVD